MRTSRLTQTDGRAGLIEERPRPAWQILARLKRAFAPLIPFIILDLFDFLTFGVLGLYVGLIVGVPMGYWICARQNLSFGKCLCGAFGAGIYCSLPFTEFIPAATLIGIWARFMAEPEM